MILFIFLQQYFNKLLYNLLVILLFLYNKEIVCLISFNRPIDLFPASNWPISIGNLVNKVLGVYIFIPDPSWSVSDFDRETPIEFE